MLLKKCLLLLSLGSFTAPLLANSDNEQCYRLSKARTFEILCVQSAADSSSYKIQLRIENAGRSKVFAEFNYDSVQRVRCGPDCNQDHFRTQTPVSNSIFNALEIRFDGKVSNAPGSDNKERGTVSIGKNIFRYEKM